MAAPGPSVSTPRSLVSLSVSAHSPDRVKPLGGERRDLPLAFPLRLSRSRSRLAGCRFPRTRGSADNTCAPHQPQPHHGCARRHIAALDRAQRVVAYRALVGVLITPAHPTNPSRTTDARDATSPRWTA